MKLPKSFRPDKDLEENIQRLLESEGYDQESFDSHTVEGLLMCCDDFLYECSRQMTTPLRSVAKSVLGSATYTKNELEVLSRSMKSDDGTNILGFFFSELINNIIDPTMVLNLKFNYPFDGLCAELGFGVVKIKGNVGRYLGQCMDGGSIIVEGNAGSWLGHMMYNGNITVNGDADFRVGDEMKGGSIEVYGSVNSIGSRKGGSVRFNGKK
ncbi:MAG: hypothetical protein L6408_01170 [Nanoarchaeota archaeon]|nr:hypothetical protein [Nanoarchaeota archaeon]